jgi:DNA (cytosine-5)-methyltransferase 1
MNFLEHLKLLEQYHTSGSRSGLEYKVVFRLVNAADYGVAQQRHRLVIVGFRSDLEAQWSFPEPTHSKEALYYAKFVDGSYYWEKHHIAKSKRPLSPLRGQAKSQADFDLIKCPQRWRTVRDAITDLPDPKSKKASQIANHEFRDGARAYTGHTGSFLDEPSKTIKAGAHGVPGGENMVMLDDSSLRYYTVRESARIQTFPDTYLFQGSWTESMRQIGNAVPVRLANIIGESVARQLKVFCPVSAEINNHSTLSLSKFSA